MRCHQCGCENSETLRVCTGCGHVLGGSASVAIPRLLSLTPETAPAQIGAIVPLQSLGYATMGERFLAFLCDSSVGAILVGAFLALTYSKSSLDFDSLKQLVLWVIPPSYMTLSEYLFHGSIGKKLLRIQLQAGSAEPRYPSFIQILLREFVGKFVSGALLGIGFLAGTWDAENKTWADRMAKTVVVKIGHTRRGLKAVLIPILIAANFGLSFALIEVPSSYEKNLAGQLVTTESTLDELHEKIFNSLFIGATWSREAYRTRIAGIGSELEEYNRLLATEEELVRKSSKFVRENHPYDRERLDTYEKVIGLRHEIAQLVQRHVQMVLALDPQKQSWDELLRDRRSMLKEINLRNNHINQIGGMFVRRRIEFHYDERLFQEEQERRLGKTGPAK